MRRLITTTSLALVLMATDLRAEDVALLLGIDRYESLDRLSRGTEITDYEQDLARMGFRVISLPNGRSAATAEALAEFAAAAPEADRIFVALAGRFVNDGRRNWLLTADATDPTLLSLGDEAVSVDSLLSILDGAQGKAILLVGRDADDEGDLDPWLRRGIAGPTAPQGVTILQGGPRVVAEFIDYGIAVPGADLPDFVRQSGLIAASGFFPDGYTFLPPDHAEVPLAPTPSDETDIAAERALWEGVVALDTVAAYRNYLSSYPRGEFATQAEEAIAAIIAEPNRDARMAEESLDLSRDARRDIQRNLTLLGFETRGIDGIFGAATRGAITAWQQENGFRQTGYLTAEQINRLDAQAARRAVQLEAEAARQAQIAAAADRAFWDETGARGDEAGLRAYLERYPDGLFSETATEELAGIEALNRDRAAAADRAAWDSARQTDTVSAYRAYLREQPQGAFQGEAEARIQQLQQEVELADTARDAQVAENALGLNRPTIRLVEAKLAQLDYDPGEVNGEIDGNTRRAIRNYQRDRGLPVTGFLNEATLVRLLADVVAAPTD
jgi:peptidoglycan hydrolase-like protein with peptidoglycan-binding domain